VFAFTRPSPTAASLPLCAPQSSFLERPSDRTSRVSRQALRPINIAANKARPARDSLQTGAGEAVPDVIRRPVDEIFATVKA